MLAGSRLRLGDRMTILFQLRTSPQLQIVLALDAMMLNLVLRITVVLNAMVLDTVVLDTVVRIAVVLNALVLNALVLNTVVLNALVLNALVLNTVVLDTVVLDTVVLDLLMRIAVVLKLLVLDLCVAAVSNRLHHATAFETGGMLFRPPVKAAAALKVACLTAVDAGKQSDGDCSENCCGDG